GSEFEKLHLQGYIQFNTRVTRKYVKQHFGNNLHIVVPTFNTRRKQNSDRPYKTDPEDICDECLSTKETCIQSRRSLEIKNRNGIIIEKSEEEIADNVSVISNNDNYLDQDMTSRNPGLWKKKPHKNVSKNDNQNETSQLKALEPGAQQENLKTKILVTRSKWKPEDFLIPKI
ncbi:23514_t:CDS:2, partial [Racocetra persica]